MPTARASDEDIAFAPVPSLPLDRSPPITSERLTRLYLDRLERFDPNCAASSRSPGSGAGQAGRPTANRRRKLSWPAARHPLGRQDLLIPPGSPPLTARNRIESRARHGCRGGEAAARCRRRAGGQVQPGRAGAQRFWFGGQTMNPWLLEEGASGSSAGPGAATAAGLVGFAIGSETGGSIVSPSMRCGITGLRPTYGRVPRTGAMTLCWSLDKLGPMTRGVEDACWCFRPSPVPTPATFPACPAAWISMPPPPSRPARRLFSRLDEGASATDVDRAALETVKKPAWFRWRCRFPTGPTIAGPVFFCRRQPPRRSRILP